MRLQPLRIGVALFGPARAKQRAALQDFTRPRGERREETELRRREVEGLTIDARDVRLRIDTQPPDPSGALRARRPTRTPEQRAHARGELPPAQRRLER